jgi:DNA-binding transcriptional MerR regulator
MQSALTPKMVGSATAPTQAAAHAPTPSAAILLVFIISFPLHSAGLPAWQFWYILKPLEEQAFKMTQLTIGELARKANVAVSAIRYYEDRGLLPRAHRQANNRRFYGSESVDALSFIAACRKNAMGLAAIRDLQTKLNGSNTQCAAGSAILTDAVKELSAKILELQAARQHLSRVASACSAENCGATANSCNIAGNLTATHLA